MSKANILIIDDDENVRKSLGIWLRNEGFQIFSASGSSEALELLNKKEIVLCLVDLRLKNENGVAVSQKIREQDPFIRIIIITAYPAYETAIDAMKSGIFDYISKSESHAVILKKINDAVSDYQEEMKKKSTSASQKKGIILLCSHCWVREGILNFCKDNSEFTLLATFNTFDLTKKYDFNAFASLILICESCNLEPLNAKMKEMFDLLQTYFPKSKTLMVNCNCSEQKKEELLFSKVSGFLPENISPLQLKKAFNSVLSGQLWVERHIGDKLFSQLLDASQPRQYVQPTIPFGLSRREIEVLQALAAGLSNYEISEKLFLSEKTIKTHIHNIFRKMSVKTRTQAVMKAIKNQII